MKTALAILMQGSSAQRSAFEGLIWFALVVVGLGLLFVGFTVARRLLRPRTEPEAAFSLSAIREMHARGELSDAEFAKLKARVLKDSLSS